MKKDYSVELKRKINTPFGAYCLGLMFSDGNTCKTTKDRKITSFSSDDIEAVENIKLFLGTNSNMSKNKRDSGKTTNTLQVCNDSIHDALVSIGCVNRKSHTVKWPDIDERLDVFFFAGMFDGDGSISKNRSINSWKFSIATASEDMFNMFCVFLLNNRVIFSKEKRKTKNGFIMSCTACGLFAIKILSTIYNKTDKEQIKTISRKRNLFECMLLDKIRRPVQFKQFEVDIIKNNTSDAECSELINSHKDNFGWERTKDGIRRKRRSLLS